MKTTVTVEPFGSRGAVIELYGAVYMVPGIDSPSYEFLCAELTISELDEFIIRVKRDEPITAMLVSNGCYLRAIRTKGVFKLDILSKPGNKPLISASLTLIETKALISKLTDIQLRLLNP